MDTLLDIARAIRLALYNLTTSHFLGIEVDVVLHLVLAGMIFWVAERRLGVRRAAWLLAILIVTKEILDLFLKSRLRYITGPSPEVIADIVVDILMGVAGGVLAWLFVRAQRARGTTATNNAR